MKRTILMFMCTALIAGCSKTQDTVTTTESKSVSTSNQTTIAAENNNVSASIQIPKVANSGYVGLYSLPTDNDYKALILEKKGKLFAKYGGVKEELVLLKNGMVRGKDFKNRAQFGDLKNEQFQSLSITVNGTKIKLLRVNVPQTKYEETFYSGMDSFQTEKECTTGLKTGSMAEVNADSKLISDLVKRLKLGFYGKQNSLLIMKDGKLVVEKYFRQWDQKENHQMQAMSKSLTSLLLGDAIAKGFILT